MVHIFNRNLVPENYYIYTQKEQDFPEKDLANKRFKR